MNKINILKVLNKDEVSKAGKPYIKCSVKTLDKNGLEVWLNGFGNNVTKSWVDGQTVDLDIFSEEYNGKTSLKFKTPQEINQLELLLAINRKLDTLLGTKTSSSPVPTPTASPSLADELNAQSGEEIKTEDIPF